MRASSQVGGCRGRRALTYGVAAAVLACTNPGPAQVVREAPCASPARCTKYLLPACASMDSIWGSSEGDFRVDGAVFSGPDGRGFTSYSPADLHWKGGAWTWETSGTCDTSSTSMGSGPLSRSFTQSAITGSGPSDVWSLGLWEGEYMGSPNHPAYWPYGLIRHWNGTAWTETYREIHMTGGEVWAGTPIDAWATSNQYGAMHWDGASWTQVSSAPVLAPHGDGYCSVGSSRVAAWGILPADVWSVGVLGSIAHWDGVSWTTVPSGTTAGLKGVWSGDPSDAWAVGEAGTVLRWNGTAWTSVPSDTTADLTGVWGTPGGDVWAVGKQLILRLRR